MIYLTQLIYIKEGEEKTFLEFEEIAIPLMKKYNGEMILRLRPDDHSVIDIATETPYEVHFMFFESELDLNKFMNDETRKKFLGLKEKSIKSSVLIKGKRM